jgi:FixJ family two-component response regulator
MKAGAIDFLEKPASEELLLAAIAHGADETKQLRSAHVEQAGLLERFARLTPRERDVSRLVTAGLLNKQVGAELGHRGKDHKDPSCASS